MSEYRIIIAGKLEFGSDRVFNQVLEQYTHRMEHYYKNDILLKPEEFFKPEELTLDVPRTVVVGSERHWLNTLNLLERVVSFSMAGSLSLWRLNVGSIMDHRIVTGQQYSFLTAAASWLTRKTKNKKHWQ